MSVGFGPFRSAMGEGNWRAAWMIANALKHPDEKRAAILTWWRSAHMETVARQLMWWMEQPTGRAQCHVRHATSHRFTVWMELNQTRIPVPDGMNLRDIAIEWAGRHAGPAHVCVDALSAWGRGDVAGAIWHAYREKPTGPSDEEWWHMLTVCILNTIRDEMLWPGSTTSTTSGAPA